MDLKELDSFKMSDAIAFHDQLNPKLFYGQRLRPDVDEQLQVIARDFLSELGIRDLDVKDITISGSNAAFSYTPNSDLDLHILVDLSQYSDDEVYQELFHAKKNLYNDSHDITINGIPVELYIQDASEPVVSLGEYSILQDKWLRLPSKRRSNLDQTATRQKYEKLSKVAEYALHTKDLDKLKKVLETIKRYRQAGLDLGGEFGPENLAYKVLRSQGVITKLYDLRDKLHSQRLSIEGMYSVEEADEKMYKHTPTVEQLVIKYKVPKRDILIQLEKGIKVELEHTNERSIAREIALDHIGEDPHYYNKLEKANLEEATEHYDGIEISLEKENDEIMVTAMANGKELGQVLFVEENGYLLPQDLEVDERYRGQGIASTMYNYVKSQGYKIRRSGQQTDAGSGFWGKHRPEQNVWEDDTMQYASEKTSAVNPYGGLEDNQYRGSISEASGYIPSEKEKNDPRFKTALTVDVHPDSIKKNAKAFGWLTSRAGIPPTAKANGKI